MKKYDVIIIGGGPGGYSAALYAARAGLDTLVIEKMSVGGQMALTSEIENYPGIDKIDGFSLGMNMQASAERFGAVTEYGEVEGVEVDGENKRVLLSGGEVREAKNLVIATGASPRLLGIPGEAELTGAGVHYCAHCDGRFYEGRTVAVIGGGNSAVGDAAYLARLAKRVILIHRRDELRATRVEAERLASHSNVEYKWNASPIAVEQRDESLTLSLIKKDVAREDIEVDGVFISIGREPESRLFRHLVDVDDGGYIIADESTRTSVPGIYAVGDVRTKALRQIITAAADGATAAHMIESEM